MRGLALAQTPKILVEKHRQEAAHLGHLGVPLVVRMTDVPNVFICSHPMIWAVLCSPCTLAEGGGGVQAARMSAGTMEVATWGAFRNWRTWALASISMLEAVVKNAILYWCPLIIHSLARPALARSHARTTSLPCAEANRAAVLSSLHTTHPLARPALASPYAGTCIMRSVL